MLQHLLYRMQCLNFTVGLFHLFGRVAHPALQLTENLAVGGPSGRPSPGGAFCHESRRAGDPGIKIRSMGCPRACPERVEGFAAFPFAANLGSRHSRLDTSNPRRPDPITVKIALLSSDTTTKDLLPNEHRPIGGIQRRGDRDHHHDHGAGDEGAARRTVWQTWCRWCRCFSATC